MKEKIIFGILLVSLVLVLTVTLYLNFTEASKSDVCDYDLSSKNYFGRNASECDNIVFVCGKSESKFADSCGCGCQRTGFLTGNSVRETICGTN